MKFLSLRFMICLLGMAAFCIPAFADGSHDRTQFGHDVFVGADEQVSEVTCFGCSVHVRGHVDGDVTTFGGAIVVEEFGDVGGDSIKTQRCKALRCSEAACVAIRKPRSRAMSPHSADLIGSSLFLVYPCWSWEPS